MTYGYNKAMYEKDTKYKVYLNQDIFIINSKFIFDILNLLENKEIYELVLNKSI